MSDRPVRNLRRAVLALALIPIATGLLSVLLGSGAVRGGGVPTPSVESELRFMSVWWLGAGLFLAWLSRDVERRVRELRAFAALLVLGGVSRVLAILDSGWPDPLFVVLMGFELTLGPVLVFWQTRVARGLRAAGA